MPVEAVRHEILFFLCPAAFVHLSIERGEEQVLQDRFVEDRFLVADLRRGEAFEGLSEDALVEQCIGDESLLLHKPAEHQARDETDDADVILAILLGGVLWKFRIFECPEIPVGNFQKEPLVEFRTVERLLPSGMEGNKVGEVVPFAKRIKRQVKQNFDVGAMRIGDADVFNQRDFFQHVLGFIAFMQTAIDNGERKRIAMPEQKHDRHREQPVYCAGNAGKLGAGILGLLERNGEEQIRLHRRPVVFGFALK